MVDGQLLFESDGKFTITAHDGQEDNIKLNGKSITFDAGDMADKIEIQKASIVKGNDGNDTIINRGVSFLE